MSLTAHILSVQHMVIFTKYVLKKWMNEMLAHHQLHILDFTCLDLCPRGDQAGC